MVLVVLELLKKPLAKTVKYIVGLLKSANKHGLNISLLHMGKIENFHKVSDGPLTVQLSTLISVSINNKMTVGTPGPNRAKYNAKC